MFAPYKRHVLPAFDARTGVYRTTHDDDRPWPASTTTVLAIADLMGVDPTEMLPLAGAVDPETLNSHVERTDSDGEVSFGFHGYDVTVQGDGCIQLEPVQTEKTDSLDHPRFDQHEGGGNNCGE